MTPVKSWTVWLAVRKVWESTLGSLVDPALESGGHQPSKSASLDQLDLWPLCFYVFDAQESRRDLDANFEPLQSSRLRAKRPSCQSVVKTTNLNHKKKKKVDRCVCVAI